jgi:hypothetical protein
MDASPDFNLLDSVKYLYLRELSEPRDNSLRLVVDEATDIPSSSARVDHLGLPELAEILKDARAIETTESCRRFELTWERYVAYLVTEECAGSCGITDDETFSGKLFRVYTKSHFLGHLARDTGGHFKVVRHYKLICLNHLVDVASYAPPEVRLVRPAHQSAPIRVQ